jgi:aldehyde dehydrogenase (NAD+)
MNVVPHYPMWIDGGSVDSPDRFEIHHPKNAALVATAAKGTIADADRAVAAARASFESGVWADLPPAERSAVMLRISQRFNELFDEFVELECMCNGATVRQATGFHVGYASFHWNYFAELAATYPFETLAPTAKWPTLAQSWVRREPLGVCAAVTPWNFPLLLTLWKVGPALAAGNSIIVKPDEKTPLTILRFAEIATECGVPAGVFSVVTGEGETVGSHLVSHPDVDKVAFTGSTPVGRTIARLGADTIKRITLELGGKSPVVVFDDADIETAVDAALFGCMLYSGQACESGTRLLLQDSIHDAFVDRLVARAKQITLGDPDDFDTDMGPVVSAEQQARILGYIRLGEAEGAKIVLGGGVPIVEGCETGYWVEPTIFIDVDNTMRIAREEIFGPVLCVLRFNDDAEAITIANDTEYGLAAAVWSSDNERAMDAARRIRAGTVWINDHHAINCEVPFGGFKQSGVGRELGPRALDAYTEVKNIHLDLSGRLDRRAYDVLLSTPPSGTER